MRIFARVQDGIYVETILPAFYTTEAEGWSEGDESRIGKFIPIDERYPPFLVVDMHEITDLSPTPEIGWIWDGESFSEPPPPYIDPRPPILAELADIDRASARPLRSLIIANPDIGAGTTERQELEALESRAVDLRAQLEALDDPQQP